MDLPSLLDVKDNEDKDTYNVYESKASKERVCRVEGRKLTNPVNDPRFWDYLCSHHQGQRWTHKRR
jgi:hypothetical protein